jgi:hypothetical protein
MDFASRELERDDLLDESKEAGLCMGLPPRPEGSEERHCFSGCVPDFPTTGKNETLALRIQFALPQPPGAAGSILSFRQHYGMFLKCITVIPLRAACQ